MTIKSNLSLENNLGRRQTKNVRFGQRNLLPKSVKIRNLGDIITTTSLATASSSLDNGDEVVFTITTSNPDEAKLFSLPDITLYVGTVTAANILPGGSSIDESQWQVIGPWNDWATTDNQNTKTKIYVRNISAGASQTVTIKTQVRTITNTEEVS